MEKQKRSFTGISEMAPAQIGGLIISLLCGKEIELSFRKKVKSGKVITARVGKSYPDKVHAVRELVDQLDEEVNHGEG